MPPLELLLAWWLSADAVTKEMHIVMSDRNGDMHTAIRKATRFKVDIELEAWVEDQNMQKGISPVPSVFLRRANEMKAAHGLQIPKTHKGSRKWMARWRVRRAVKLRLLPARERIAVEDKHQKVTHD